MGEVNFVITNTSPLINLDKAGAIDKMIELFKENNLRLIIPPMVLGEIRNRELNDTLYQLNHNGDVNIKDLNEERYSDCIKEISFLIALDSKGEFEPEEHDAEAQVICFGKDIGSQFVLLDEKAAREIAKKKGLRAMGHIDIIKMCVDDSIVTPQEGLSFLDKLESLGVKYKSGLIEHHRRLWS